MTTSPTDFLYEAIDKLANGFPAVQFSYGYNERIDTHVVQIEPLSAYYENEKLDAAWIPVALEFEMTFNEESVCFISSDSSLAVAAPTKSWNKNDELRDYNQFVHTILNASNIQYDLGAITIRWSELNKMIVEFGGRNTEHILDQSLEAMKALFQTAPTITKPHFQNISNDAVAEEGSFLCAA